MSLADAFERAAAATDVFQSVELSLIEGGVTIKERISFRSMFETWLLYSDPELVLDSTASANWRVTAFCFAAAMVRQGGGGF